MRRYLGTTDRVAEYRLNKALARQQYSHTFFTMIAPFLMLIATLSNAIGRTGGLRPFFTQHWVFGPIATVIVAVFLYFIVADIRKARAYAKKAGDFWRE